MSLVSESYQIMVLGAFWWTYERIKVCLQLLWNFSYFVRNSTEFRNFYIHTVEILSLLVLFSIEAALRLGKNILSCSNAMGSRKWPQEVLWSKYHYQKKRKQMFSYYRLTSTLWKIFFLCILNVFSEIQTKKGL